jgi:hypothetical protein
MPQGYYGMNSAKAAAARVLGRRPASVVATSANSHNSNTVPRIPTISMSFDRQYGMFSQPKTETKTHTPKNGATALFNNVFPSTYQSAPSSPASAAARGLPVVSHAHETSKIHHSKSFGHQPATPKVTPTAAPWTVGRALQGTKPVPPRFLPADRQGNLEDIKERYTFTRELGRGKFGVVYEAVDKFTDEKVAVKVLDKVQCGPAQCNHELKMMEQIKSQVSHDRFTPIKGMFISIYLSIVISIYLFIGHAKRYKLTPKKYKPCSYFISRCF